LIFNIVSTPTIAGHTACISYNIAKAGIIAITKYIALQYDNRNILAYALALDNIFTDATFSSMTLTVRKKALIENSMKTGGHLTEVPTIAAGTGREYFSFSTVNIIAMESETVVL
jgi:NAD(P)-dependent dehydrogenase (short-subunit alcohol dehydrogenase family)